MGKRAVVCGAGGFIASHLVKRLKREGYWVRGVDVKRPEFADTAADEFLLLDLRDEEACRRAVAGDVDGDGLLDLVLHVTTENLSPDSFQAGLACLTGETYGGQPIEGWDEITIVPPG